MSESSLSSANGTGPPRRDPPTQRAEGSSRERRISETEARKRAIEALEKSGHTNREILEKVAEKALEIPPDENVIELGAAAATLSLISLESARLLAEQVRAEIEIRRDEAIRSVAGGVRADRTVEALLG